MHMQYMCDAYAMHMQYVCDVHAMCMSYVYYVMQCICLHIHNKQNKFTGRSLTAGYGYTRH